MKTVSPGLYGAVGASRDGDTRRRASSRETVMKLSARNILKGKVRNITNGAVASEVEVDVGNGNVITSTITVGSAKRLGLAQGKEVSVIIKASAVIIGVDD